MTLDDLKAINLPLSLDDTTALYVEAAYDWILDNTTATLDFKNIPANFKLFMLKFVETMSLNAGVASESIEGLSQSFDGSGKDEMIRQYAKELIGAYLKSDGKIMPSIRRWV